MSIHGFMDQNGQIQKYDYTDLENKPTIPAEVLIDDTLTEEGQAADAKAVGDALDNITIPVDPTLTQQGAAADAKAVGDAIDNIDSGLSPAAKQALLEIFQHVAYIDEHGQDYYDALEIALAGGQSYTITVNLTGCTSSNTATSIIEGHTYSTIITASSGYTLEGATVVATMGGQTVTGFYNNGTISIPNVTGDLVITVTATSSVASISAVFTQGSATVYDTDSLDTLRQYLVVTATYSDSTTATVTDYTLSGTLAEGISTITASYGGKTANFAVVVSAEPYIPAEYQQVEYLQILQSNSSNGVYFNTNKKFTSSMTTATFRSSFQNIANANMTDGQRVLSAPQNGQSQVGWALYVSNTHQKLVSWALSPGAAIDVSVEDSYLQYNLVATYTSNKVTIQQIGVGEEVSFSGTMRNCRNTNIGVFGTYGQQFLFNGKIFYAQVEEDGVMILDLVPCVRKSDDAIGFYDRVDNVFISPATVGTGTLSMLTAGPNVGV